MRKSRELSLEEINDRANTQMKVLECIYNRSSVTERYIKGELIVHLHGIFRDIGVCLNISADTKRRLEDNEMHMLVWVGDFPKDARPITSIARLQPANHCDMNIIYPAEIDALMARVTNRADSTDKSFATILNRKLCALYDLLGIKASQLINEIIKGGTQVIYTFTDKDTHAGGNWPKVTFMMLRQNLMNGLLSLYIRDASDNVWASLEIRDHNLQVRQVFATPSNPLISAIQTLHMLYSFAKGLHSL